MLETLTYIIFFAGGIFVGVAGLIGLFWLLSEVK